MEYLPLFLTIFVAHVVQMITPGPNVLLIAQASAGQSRYHGLKIALGVASTSFVWPSLAILGLNVIFEQMVWLYIILKWLGASYLIFLGIKSWQSADKLTVLTSAQQKQLSSRSPYQVGVLTSLTNPKTLVFMGSFLAALLPATSPIWVKIAVVAMFTINSLWWHTLVAYALSLRSIQQGYLSIKKKLDRVVGVLFVLLGLRLAVSGRPS